MSSGTDLLATLNQVRDFFEQTASLLGTADAMMQKQTWKATRGTMVTADLSYALYGARQWMPHYLCRSYVRADKPAIVPSISILLGVFERDISEQRRLTEPLICASIFQYANAEEAKEWNIAHSTWHLWTPNRKDDGSVCKTNPKAEWPEDDCPATIHKSLALPLLSIENSQELEQRIVNPLLNLLK